jgi:DUF971 family protein
MTEDRTPPLEIRLPKDKRSLIVTFADGVRHELAAEYLRVESPSAEVQGHNPVEKRIVAGKREVAISAVEPVGSYAVRLVFDDGHDTGLFTWTNLRRLGDEHATLWPAYLAGLAAQGLSREG